MFIFFGRNRNLLLRGHSLMTSTENDQKTQKFKYIYHLKTIEFAVTWQIPQNDSHVDAINVWYLKIGKPHFRRKQSHVNFE